jgi:hypothetical protein
VKGAPAAPTACSDPKEKPVSNRRKRVCVALASPAVAGGVVLVQRIAARAETDGDRGRDRDDDHRRSRDDDLRRDRRNHYRWDDDVSYRWGDRHYSHDNGHDGHDAGH